MSRPWIFDGEWFGYGYFFVHAEPFGAGEAIRYVVVCGVRCF